MDTGVAPSKSIGQKRNNDAANPLASLFKFAQSAFQNE